MPNNTNISGQSLHLAMNGHNASHAPYFKNTLGHNIHKDVANKFNALQTYVQLFGSQDSTSSDHDRSLDSPAAYFVDLMRLIEGSITAPEGLLLKERRPDLFALPLGPETTNTEVSYLQIVNDVMAIKLAKELDSKSQSPDPILALQYLATTGFSTTKDRRAVPNSAALEVTPADLPTRELSERFVLPYNAPLEEIRAYLRHCKTDLAAIFSLFGVEGWPLVRERLGLSPEECDWIGTDPKIQSDIISPFTGQSVSLLRMWCPDAGDKAYWSKVYIRARLAVAFGWSRVDCDRMVHALLSAMTAKDEADDLLYTRHNLNAIKRLQERHAFSFDELLGFCSRSFESISSSKETKDDNFCTRIFNRPTRFFGDAGAGKIGLVNPKSSQPVTPAVWNVQWGKENDKDKDVAIRARMRGALGINDSDLTAIANRVLSVADPVKDDALMANSEGETNRALSATSLPPRQKRVRNISSRGANRDFTQRRGIDPAQNMAASAVFVNTPCDALKLTHSVFAQFYKYSKMSTLLGLSVTDTLLLLDLLGLTGYWDVQHLGLVEVSECATWLAQANLSVGQLSAIVNGKDGAGPDMDAAKAGIRAALAEVIKNKARWSANAAMLVSDDRDEHDAELVFQQMITSGFISTDGTVVLKDASVVSKDASVVALVERRRLQVNSLTATMASTFGCDSVTAGALIRLAGVHCKSEHDMAAALLQNLSDDDVKTLAWLRTVSAYLGLNATDLDNLLHHPEWYGITKRTIDISAVRSICISKQVARSFSDQDNILLPSLAKAETGGDTKDEKCRETLVALIGCDRTQLNDVLDHPAYKNGKNLVARADWLRRCLDQTAATGLTVKGLSDLVALSDLRLDGPDRAEKNKAWEAYQLQANVLLEAIRSKRPASSDNDGLADVREKLAESKRNALVSALCPLLRQHYSLVGDTFNWFEAWEDVSKFLLMDIENSSVVKISRVKQGLNTLQLYIHRCRSGLEPWNKGQIPEQQWSWMSHYRVWEANRKVFLYPENYLDPSLRKRKTPLFAELQGELLQGDMTAEAVAAAYRNYFDKFERLARLDIVSSYYCPVTTRKNGKPESTNTLFLIGRTDIQPHTFYYRTAELEVIGDLPTIVNWTPWQQIDLTINAESVTPIFAFQKLFLFWVEQKVETQTKSFPDARDVRFEVTKASVKYSFHNVSGTWAAPQPLAGIQDFPIHVTCNEIDAEMKSLMTRLHALATEAMKDSVILGELNTEMAAQPWFSATEDFIFFSIHREGYVNPGKVLKIAKRMRATSEDYNRILQAENEPDKRLDKLHAMRQTIFDGYSTWVVESDVSKPVWQNVHAVRIPSEKFPPEFPPERIVVMYGWPPSKETWCENSLLIQRTLNAGLDESDGPILKATYFHHQFRLSGLGDLVSVQDYTLSSYANNDDRNVPFDRVPTFLKSISARANLIPVHNCPEWAILNNEGEAFLAVRQGNQSGSVSESLKLRNFLEISGNKREVLTYFTRSTNPESDDETWSYPAAFIRLGTSRIHELNRTLMAGGLDQLLTPDSQQIPEPDFSRFLFSDDYKNHQVAHYPENASLDFDGPYGDYFWEVFFHIPFLIASALNTNQRFEEAQKWYQYIFNPTARPAPEPHGHDADRFWRFLPFRERSFEKLKQMLTNSQTIGIYEDDPFDPDAIARLRIGAYEKAIVMRYIDNLLDWGDSLFAQDTWESISQATMLYVLAADLLGKRPLQQESPNTSPLQTFDELEKDGNAMGDSLVTEINMAAGFSPVSVGTESTGYVSFQLSDLKYFCVPENEEFVQYWDRVEDRLYKIRHGMNIKGILRQLALFEPPIDPRQLIGALATGATLDDALPQIAAPIPHYRFAVMVQQAKSLTASLSQLGAGLVAALEKKDAAELTRLRAGHEKVILNLTTRLKEQQIDEAAAALEALKASLASATQRRDHYQQLLDAGLSEHENRNIAMMDSALDKLDIARGVRWGAVAAHLIPTIYGLADGGFQPGSSVSEAASLTDAYAGMESHRASMAMTVGQNARREEEWNLNLALAGHDIEQITQQIEASTIAQAVSQKVLEIHNKTVEQAGEMDDYLKRRFGTEELYQWMIGRIRGIYNDTYNLAMQQARAAQRAYKFERNTGDTFINPSYSDTLHMRLLAGEELMAALEHMEVAYRQDHARELEIEKTISLLQLNPKALLDLKSKGTCDFDLDERLFDQDFPGHYCRKIASVAISVPAIVGPYQNVQASLTQLTNRVVLTPEIDTVAYLLSPQRAKQDMPGDDRLRSNLRALQQIAISKGVNDSGVFELNFHDERYLPFEGTGAVSSWKLTMLKAANRGLDFASISDVIIHLRYTALDGGEAFRNKVTSLPQISKFEGHRLFSLRHDFSGDWQKAQNGGGLKVAISEDMFPMNLKLGSLKLGEIIVSVFPPVAKQANPLPDKLKATDVGQKSTSDPNLKADKVVRKWSVDTKQKNLDSIDDIIFLVPFSGELDWGSNG